jgi:gliding motility-associated-like protein
LLGNDTICAGDSLQLTSNQPTKNLWSTGDTTQSIWVSLAGTYFARQRNSLQCPGDTSNVLTIWVQNQPPKPSITANGNTTICQGDSVQLSTTTTGPVLWSTGATTPSVWVSQGGLYFLRTNVQNVCPDAFSDSINITTLPTPQTPTVTPLGDTALCNGNPVTLSSSLATGNRWSTGDTTQSITLTSPGTVALWQAAASGCTSDTVYFTVAQADIDLGPDVSMCAGESITLTVQGSGSYAWSTGASGPSINVAPATTTTYWAQEAGSGCSDTVVVTVHPAPKAQFTVTPTQGPAPLAIQVNNTSTGATSYSWTFGDGNTSTQPNPTHSYVQDGSYTIRLVVTNAFGCADTAISTPVQVISANNFWIPNSFTPGNRDGVNDVWEMQGIPEPYQFSVFDRWGNRVYYSADYQNNWDGTYNGQPLPLGAYTYLIEYRYINPNATVANPEGAPRSIQGVMIIQ